MAKCKDYDDYEYNSGNGNSVTQGAAQGQQASQFMREVITMDNCNNVTIISNQTQTVFSLQAAIQLALVLAINIFVINDEKAAAITQELAQYTSARESSYQEIHLKNTVNSTIVATDTQTIIQIQLLIQILFVLLVQLGVLNA